MSDFDLSKIVGNEPPWECEECEQLRTQLAQLDRQLRNTCGCGWQGDKNYVECADHAALRAQNDKLKTDLRKSNEYGEMAGRRLAEAQLEIGRLKNSIPDDHKCLRCGEYVDIGNVCARCITEKEQTK